MGMVVDAVGIPMEQVTLAYREAADTDGKSQVEKMTIGVGADGGSGEDGVAEGLDLQQISSPAGGNQADRSEALIDGAHDLAKGGPDGWVIEILEDHDGWPGQIAESVNLIHEIAIGVTTRRRGIAPKGSSGGKADHGGQLGKARTNPRIHEAGVSRSGPRRVQ